jgi:pimeloyl-ACP methyl ester carboxylesterase
MIETTSTVPPGTHPSRSSRLLRAAKLILIALLITPLLLGCSLYFFQRKMMYFPEPYLQQIPTNLNQWSIRQISYTTKDGAQVALLATHLGADSIESSAGTFPQPERLWVAFNGNASLALDWAWLMLADWEPETPSAFLLVDYPGYGLNEGKPTRPGIIRNGKESLLAACRHMNWNAETLPLGSLGFSMGSAAAMEFAAAHPGTDRIILLAPFTSMLDMAKRTVPFPFHHVAVDRFNNKKRLQEVLVRPKLRVTILHGEADQVIPVEMGRRLAELDPQIELLTKPGVGHEALMPFMREILERVETP